MGADLKVAWASASKPMAGQALLGDGCWTWQGEGRFRVAVIDGLGHGFEAAQAAGLARQCLEEHPAGELGESFALCHARLGRTRGAVISMAVFDLERAEIEWAGIGNVEGMVVRGPAWPELPKRVRLSLKGGIVGYSLPDLRRARVQVLPGDVVVLTTDGINPQFAEEMEDWGTPPEQLAAGVLAGWGKSNDDALVWIGRLEA